MGGKALQIAERGVSVGAAGVNGIVGVWGGKTLAAKECKGNVCPCG
jgi:hypothetical protein